jgi:hypothetical protein
MPGDHIELVFERRDVVASLPTKVRSRHLRPEIDLTAGGAVIGGDLLQVAASSPALHGAIDLIVADPPWSGRDFFYDERWERDPNELGSGTESAATGQEADWLRWLLPRLHVLRDLLAPTGVFVTTCDHRGLFLLGQLVDEVFGVDNRISVIGWEKAYSYGERVGATWDYLVVVARSLPHWRARSGGDHVWDPPQWWPASGGDSSLDEAPLEPSKGYTTHGTVELDRVLGRGHGSRAAKPSSLYRRLIEQWSAPEALVLDPFAGSGACGQAASETGRRFVLVDRPDVVTVLTLRRLEATGVPATHVELGDYR